MLKIKLAYFFAAEIINRVPVAYGIAYLTRSEAYPTGRPESTFISLLVSYTFCKESISEPL